MYWEEAGSENTDRTLRQALKRGQELGINTYLIASASGDTVKRFLALDKQSKVVCVTHQVGFKDPGKDEMDAETRTYFHELGVQVLTTTHLFAGLDRALRFKFNGVYPAEIMAQTLRIFGQGIKVAIEISCMALDAGLIPYGQDIIAIGGSAKGADAAIIIRPAHSARFFDTQVREIICMPRNK